MSGSRAVILGCFGLSASAMVRRRLSATKVPFPTAAGVPNHWPTDQSIPGSPPGAPTHRNLRRDTLACPNFHPYDLPALSFSTGTPASPPEGSITLKTKPDRRGTPSPADHFYQLTGIPFPPVHGSSAMHNPRSMIHDLASTAHDSRSAPRSPICNLRCSINDPRITAQGPGTSELQSLLPSRPLSPEFTSDCRGAAGMPGIQPDLKPKSSSNSVFDQSTMQPLPYFLNTPGFGPLTPKSSRRRCTILDP